MSDDDVTLFGKLKNKLIDSKQKWAEDGRLLTGKTGGAMRSACRPASARSRTGRCSISASSPRSRPMPGGCSSTARSRARRPGSGASSPTCPRRS